jgi:hypothetical protein
LIACALIGMSAFVFGTRRLVSGLAASRLLVLATVRQVATHEAAETRKRSDALQSAGLGRPEPALA